MFKNNFLAYLMILPQIILISLFFIYPSITTIWKSFFFQSSFGDHYQWVGWLNYSTLLEDTNYLNSWKVTIYMTLFITFFSLIFGLIIAELTHYLLKETKISHIYRTLMTIPYVFSSLAIGVLTLFLFDPFIGVITTLLQQSFNYQWNHLLSKTEAFFLIVGICIWKQITYNFLFLFIALKRIPKELIETAILDNVGTWKRFFKVKIPLISPIILFLIVTNIIYAIFDTFSIIHVTTKGGPFKATTTLMYQIFVDGFLGLDLSIASTQSVILMGIIILLVTIQFKYLDKLVTYK